MARNADVKPLKALENVPLSVRKTDHLGLSLVYRVWGDPTKPAIILQHGGKDHGRSWDYVISALVEDYCCIAPDLRGHGDSGEASGAGYNIRDFVTDFALVVDAIKADGIAGPYIIIGHSLGGMVTLHYAAACPEDVSLYFNIEGLGFAEDRYNQWLAAPVVERWSRLLAKRRAVVSRTRRSYHEDVAIQTLAKIHTKLPTDMVEYLARHGLRPFEDGYVWKHDAAMDYTTVQASPPEKNLQLIRAVTAPTILFYGGASFLGPFDPDDQRFGEFRSSKVYFYEDAGHWLHHEELERFLGDLNTQLAAHGRG